jgi:hypothetical protein
MKQTELITGVGGEQGRMRPGWCAWLAMPPSLGATRHVGIKRRWGGRGPDPVSSQDGRSSRLQYDRRWRAPGRIRSAAVRRGHAKPSACVTDAQSAKTSTSVPASGQGLDAGKKIAGRKQSFITDAMGLLLDGLVTPANEQDSTADGQLLDVERWRCWLSRRGG